MILDKATISRRILKLMKERKISKIELGRAIGSQAARPQNLILAANRSLNPKNQKLDLKEMKAVCQLLGTTPEYLLGMGRKSDGTEDPYAKVASAMSELGIPAHLVEAKVQEVHALALVAEMGKLLGE